MSQEQAREQILRTFNSMVMPAGLTPIQIEQILKNFRTALQILSEEPEKK